MNGFVSPATWVYFTNSNLSLGATDPALAGVSEIVTYWGTADLVGGSGPQRGYFVDVHANGDRDIGTFEGKVKTAGGQVTIEGTWKYSDGTGQFKGLTGGGTYKGRMTSPTEVENTWEGTYQLAAKARVA